MLLDSISLTQTKQHFEENRWVTNCVYPKMLLQISGSTSLWSRPNDATSKLLTDGDPTTCISSQSSQIVQLILSTRGPHTSVRASFYRMSGCNRLQMDTFYTDEGNCWIDRNYVEQMDKMDLVITCPCQAQLCKLSVKFKAGNNWTLCEIR